MDNNKKALPWKLVSAALAVALITVSCIWIFTSVGKGKAPESTSASLGATASEASGGEGVFARSKEKRKLIIDTDTGGDDAVALIIAAKTENVEILGVTVSAGNVSLDQAVKNALMTLETANCDAPVYAGASSTYSGVERETFSVYGEDGMGDNDLIHPTREAEDKNAVDFILDTVKANPGEVEIVALGPVTNIALALDKGPGVMKQAKKIWSMGTCGFGPGNATPVAEFNVYHDAEAYKVLVESGIPVTAIGLDMLAEETFFTEPELDTLEEKGGISRFVSKAFDGLVKFNKEGKGMAVADDPDGVAMACVLWDGYLLETVQCHAVVMTDSDDTYGQVVLYRKDYSYDSGITFEDYNFYVAKKTEHGSFKQTLVELFEAR